MVDRWDRRRTLIIANFVQIAAVVPLIAFDRSGQVWIAFPSAFILSSMQQFVGPAEHALLPRLVDPDQLPVANALNTLNNNLARLIGPAIAGIVMSTSGLSATVALTAAFHAIAAMSFLAISVASQPGNSLAPIRSETTSIRSDWADGFKLLRRRPEVRTLVGVGNISSFGQGIMGVMFVVWVTDVLGGGARELGWLMSAQAVGGIAGGLLLGLIVSRIAPISLFGYGAIVFGALDLALFNYPRAFEGLWIGVVLIGLVGLPAASYVTGLNTLMQETVEDEYRGRVYGTMGMTGAILQLSGTAIAGLLGGMLGPLFLLNLQGGAYVLQGVLALVLIGRVRTDRPEPAGGL